MEKLAWRSGSVMGCHAREKEFSKSVICNINSDVYFWYIN